MSEVNYREEFASAVQSFFRAASVDAPITQGSITARMTAILQQDTNVNESDLTRIVLYLLTDMPTHRSEMLMKEILVNASLPVNVVTAAARSAIVSYRMYAVQNPACLEEDRVYVALLND
jgi:hypothetical protein